MVTQVDDGAPIGPGDGGDLPTSSVSAPSIAAGFGTVTTIIGDGSLGYAPQAPYDRVIATVGSKYLPYAWVAQTSPGGRIVAPSWALNYCGLLLALTASDDGTAAGHFVDDASFMMLRNQRSHRIRQLISDSDNYAQATVTETELHPAEVASASYSRGAVIAIGTRVPDCRSDYFPSRDPDSRDGTSRWVDHLSGSWARLTYDHDGGPPYAVRQFGPRRLWDEVEAAYQWWIAHGSPTAARWQFTVTPQGQRVELH